MSADDQHKSGSRHHPNRHKAVALKGDGTLESTPKITAVGFGKTADQILDVAFANNVKVRQDSDLTDILAALEVESPVPIEALDAVSEILSYVYGLNRRMDKEAETEDTDGKIGQHTRTTAGQNAADTSYPGEQETQT